MLKHQLAAALGASALCLAAPALAQGSQCFFVTQWNGWKAPDDHTIYLNVSNNKIYKLETASSCPELVWPDSHLINRDESGSGSICGPLDFNLKVGDLRGTAAPCIISKMRLLSPEEAAAIPKKFRP
jgi:hypothetical protein